MQTITINTLDLFSNHIGSALHTTTYDVMSVASDNYYKCRMDAALRYPELVHTLGLFPHWDGVTFKNYMQKHGITNAEFLAYHGLQAVYELYPDPDHQIYIGRLAAGQECDGCTANDVLVLKCGAGNYYLAESFTGQKFQIERDRVIVFGSINVYKRDVVVKGE